MTTTETPPTMQDLVDERGRVLAQIDDIFATATAAGRSLLLEGDVDGTDYHERTEHDTLAARADELEAEIGRMTIAQSDEDRRNKHANRSAFVPMVNVITTPPPTASRSLDELLWATTEDVPAGTFDKAGRFSQHHAARSQVEQVVVSDGDDKATLAPRITEFRPEHRDAVRSFQHLVADMSIFGMMVDGQAKSASEGFQVARSHRLFKDRWTHAMRALDTDTSSEGTEWIPTGIGATLHEKVRASGKVAPLFARINLPTNPWKWPLEGADATAYRVAEPTSDTATKVTASTPGTAAATFDAEILGGRVLFSKSLEADSAVAILPFTQRKLVQAFVDAEEKAILDGDTDGTHQDTDTQAVGATHASSSWDGLRKRALAETTQATTTTTAANLAIIRKSMKKWGVNPSDLAYIVGVSSYLVLMSDSNLLTVDKMGPQATILNGMIGSLYGVPVIVSEWVREDLNASGVNDGITATKTYALCVNRNEWAMGQRSPLTVEVDDSIYRETYQRVVVAFEREDFQSIAAVSTDDNTAIGYNITSGS